GSRLTGRISAHPIGLPGQPSTCAIGFHIAITIGDSTSGSPAGAIGLVWPSRDCQAWLSSVTYAPDAGLYTTGFWAPPRIAVVASPDPIGLAGPPVTPPPAPLGPAAVDAPASSPRPGLF